MRYALIAFALSLFFICGCASTIELNCEQPENVTVILKKNNVPFSCLQSDEQIILTDLLSGKKYSVTGILLIEPE